jgi:hypothetical protein
VWVVIAIPTTNGFTTFPDVTNIVNVMTQGLAQASSIPSTNGFTTFPDVTNVVNMMTQGLAQASSVPSTNGLEQASHATATFVPYTGATAAVNLGGQSATNAGTIHGTNIVAMGTLNVSGAATFNSTLNTGGNVITGNGSGLTNMPEVIPCMVVMGHNGFGIGNNYGGCWVVACSDTDAIVNASFAVHKAGTYRIGMIWTSDTTSYGKTMSGYILCATAVHDTTLSWNVFGGLNWDLAIPQFNAAQISVYGTSFDVADDTAVYVYYAKDDNAGGANNYIYVHGFVLIRQ